MPNLWDSHTHSSDQHYSLCSSELCMLIPQMTVKWLKLRGSANKGNSRDLSTFYCDMLWLHIPSPPTMPFSAKLTFTLLVTWRKVSGVVFLRHHRQLDSPCCDDYSFSLLLMQTLPPHQSFHSGKTDCKCSSHKYLLQKKREYKSLDIFERDDVMETAVLRWGKTKLVRRLPKVWCSSKTSEEIRSDFQFFSWGRDLVIFLIIFIRCNQEITNVSIQQYISLQQCLYLYPNPLCCWCQNGIILFSQCNSVFLMWIITFIQPVSSTSLYIFRVR